MVRVVDGEVQVHPPRDRRAQMFHNLQTLLQAVPHVIVQVGGGQGWGIRVKARGGPVLRGAWWVTLIPR